MIDPLIGHDHTRRRRRRAAGFRGGSFLGAATRVVLAVAVLAAPARARADVLAGWELTGASSTTNPLAPTTTAANLAVGGFTRGSGVTAPSTPAGNAWGVSNVGNHADATTAIAANDFVYFTMRADTGYTLSLTDIAAYNVRRSSSGPTQGQWQYSLDATEGIGTFTDIGSPITWGATVSSAGNAQPAIDLSTVSALQNVAAGTTVTLRVALMTAGGTGGTWYFNQFTSGQDFVVNGTINAGGGGGGGGLFWDGASGWAVAEPAAGGSGSWADGVGGWDSTKTGYFGESPGTVTIAAAATTTQGIVFTADGYRVEGGTLGLAAAANPITVNAAATATISSVLAGTGGFTKSGAGTLVLEGTNTVSGSVALAGGTLAVATAAALGADGNALAFSGGTLRTTASLDLGGRSLSGAGALDIAAGTTLTVAGAATLSSLTLAGAGNLAFAGPAATGSIAATFSSGTATVSGAIDMGTVPRSVGVAAGGTLVLADKVTATGTGNDAVVKTGSGTLVLGSDLNAQSLHRFALGRSGTNPANDFGGTVQVAAAGALGTNPAFLNWGTLEATAPLEFDQSVSIGGQPGAPTRLAGAPMLFASEESFVFFGSGAKALVVDTDAAILSGISGTASSLTIGGTGTLRIRGDAGLMTSPVTLADAVTLALEPDSFNPQFTGILAPSVTVGGSATLAGTGRVGFNGTAYVGTLRVADGGRLSPGSSPGTLSAGSTIFEGGGNFNLQVAAASGTPGAGWDRLAVTGSLTVASTAEKPFNVNLWSLAGTAPDVSGPVADFDDQQGYSWTFVTTTGGISGFAADKFLVNTFGINGSGGFANDLAGGSFAVAASGGDLAVVFTPFIAGSTLAWYGDGVTAGGSGGWSQLGSTWSPDGGATIGTWDPTRTAVFGGSGGVVTVQPEGITASRGIQFDTGGYSIDGGAVTLGGDTQAANAISVAAATTATIRAPIAGSAGLTKAGAGTLVLTGSTGVTGGVAVAAGTLQVGDGPTAGSLAAAVAIETGARVAFDTDGATAFSGSFSGGGGVTKLGGGDLRLTGASGHSGGLRVEAGSVTAANGAAFGAGGVTAVDGGVFAEAGITTSSPIVVGEPGAAATPTLLAGWDFQTTTSGGTAILAAPATPKQFAANFGAGRLYLDGSTGSSDWASTASNPELTGFAGTAINAGPGFATDTPTPSALALANQSANGKQAVFAVDMRNFATLDVSYASQRTSSGFTSQLWEASTDLATWTPVADVTTTGTSFAITGTARLPTVTALADAPTAYLRLTLTGATTATGNNRFDNIQFLATPAATPTGAVVLGTEATTGTATFSGPVALYQPVSLTAAAGGTAVFSGGIADAVGVNGVTTLGAGTVVLAGSNTYRGPTSVEAGSLLVTGSATASGFTVAAATLGGTGAIGGLALATDATLAPGLAGVGTLTAKATTFGGGAAYDWQLQDAAGAAGSGWDLLVLDSLNVTATAESPFTVNLWTVTTGDATGDAAGFNPFQPYRWSFARRAVGSGPIAWGGADRFVVNPLATDSTGGFGNDTRGGTFSVALSTVGDGLDIVFTPDPAASRLLWYGDDESAGGKGDWANLNINWLDAGTEQLTDWNSARTAVFGTVGGEVTLAPAGISAANGIAFEAANYVLGGGNLNLTGGSPTANTITVGEGISTTITAVVAGTAGLTKAGAGTLVVAGEATVSGGAIVAGGTLQLGAGGTAGSLPGGVTVAAGATLAVSRGDEVALAGAIGGDGGLVKTAAGTLRLTGSNTYTGGTTVSEGVVVVGDGATAGGIAATGSIALAPEAVLAFDRTDAVAFNGPVSGAGTLTQLGTGTLTLSRAGTGNAYGPAFTLRVEDGTVDLFRADDTLVGILGAGNTVELAGGTLQLRSNGGEETKLEGAAIDVQQSSTLAILRTGTTNSNHSTSEFSAPLTVGNGSTLTFDFRGAIGASGTAVSKGTTTYSAGVMLASDATFAVTNSAGGTAEVIFSGPVADGGGGFGITKTGAQRLTLSGSAHTYAGATSVAAGSLALGPTATIANSPLISIAAGATLDVSAQTGGYAVAAGQTLAGGGTVAGSITIGSSATLAPGLSPGTLTVTQNLVWGSGGNYNWQIHDAAGTAGSGSGWDLVSVGGTLDVAATSQDRFRINLWSLSGLGPDANGPAINFDTTQQAAWTIASATGGITNFAAEKFSISTAAAGGTGGFAIDPGLGTFSLQLSGSTDLQLVYTPSAGPSPDRLHWHGDGVNPGGGGTWTTDGLNWWNGSTMQAWNPAATAVFAASGGTVTLGAGVEAAAGAAFTADGYTLTGAGLALTGSAGANVVDVVATVVATIAAPLSGSAGLAKAGDGGLVLSGANAFSGGTQVTAGTLAVGAGGTSGSIAGDVNVAAGATLGFERSDTVEFAGRLSGAGEVVQLGTGELVLSGSSSRTGDMTVYSGTVRVADPHALGESGVVIAAGAVLRITPGLAAAVAELDFAGGRLDVDTGRLTVASGLSGPEIVAEILLGRGEAWAWDGASGITSSFAAAEVADGQPRGIGWLDNGDGSFTIAFAAPGDTNLDGLVDSEDIQNFLAGNRYDTGLPSSWIEGDFNYDGIVDSGDIQEFLSTNLYDAGFYIPGLEPGGLAALGMNAAGPLTLVAVPEPGGLALAAFAAAALAARRRMKRSPSVGG